MPASQGSPRRARAKATSGGSRSFPCPTPTRGGGDIRTVLLVDNYDSFTWNLRQLLAAVAPPNVRVQVIANDTHSVEAILSKRLWRLVISPGPGDPSRAGVSTELIARTRLPTLGVCLGHQCLAYAFGGRIVRGLMPVHGKSSRITHNGAGIFRDVPQHFSAARYHSLVVEEASLPSCLVVTARSEDGAIMALRHRRLPLAGVQFHPESVLTEHGATIARNFLRGHL